jgi:hypothetical protein
VKVIDALRRVRRGDRVEEVCAECYVPLDWERDVWELREELDPDTAPDLGGMGGTQMAVSFCREHAPASARRLGPMSRADVLRLALLRYHAREISLRELMAVLADWRPKR